jgi:hypothetical protein
MCYIPATMKRLIVPIIFIVATSIWVASPEDNPPCPPKVGVIENNLSLHAQKSTKTNNEKCCSQNVTVNVNDGQTSDHDCNAKKSANNSHQDEEIARKLARYTLFLVIVGAITAAILIWQSYETRRAASAAKLAAEASLRQTLVLKDLERPWVDVSIEPLPREVEDVERLSL